MRESAEFKISFASSSSPTKREKKQRAARRFDKNRKSQPGRTHHEREKKVKTNFALIAAHLRNHRHPLTGELPSESELFQRIRQRLISIHRSGVLLFILFKKKSLLCCRRRFGSERRARDSSRITRGMRELYKKCPLSLCVCVCIYISSLKPSCVVTRVFFLRARATTLFSLFAAKVVEDYMEENISVFDIRKAGKKYACVGKSFFRLILHSNRAGKIASRLSHPVPAKYALNAHSRAESVYVFQLLLSSQASV